MKSFLYLVLSSALFSTHAFATAQDCGNKGDNNPPCTDKCCNDNSGSNPVNVFRGSLIRDVTDLQVFGPAPFEFKRTYNSRPRNYTLIRWEMGTTDTWQHNWQYELREATQTAFGFNAIVVRYPRGSEKFFYATDTTGSVYVSDANFGDRLYPTGIPGQFLLRSSDGEEFKFRKDLAIPNNYLLDEVKDGKGSVWTLTYQFLASRNRLTRIANNYGKFINIIGSKRPNSNFWTINSIQSNDGRTVSYSYSTWTPTNTHVLSSVTYPDSTTAQYTWVGHLSLTTGDPLLATASDPAYKGSGPRTSYTYHYGLTYGAANALKGTIKDERNTDTGEATVTLPLGAGREPLVLEGGNKPVFRKFVDNNLIQRSDAMGRMTYRVFQTVGAAANAGFLISSTEPSGATTTYTRDPMGRILTQTDALGGVTTYTYNSAGFLLTTTDPLGRTTSHTLDSSNRITRTDYPDATYETFTYTTTGLLLTKRLRNAATETNTYNSSGNLISFTDAAGHTTTHTYLPSGLLGSSTNALGQTTSYQYDWRGRLTKTTHPDSTFRTVAYDTYGNVSMQADEMLNITSYTYDSFNRRESMTDALNRTTTFAYGFYSTASCGSCSSQGSGLPVSVTYPDGSVTSYTYDLSGKLLTATKNFGTAYAATTTQAYDPAGHVQTITDALGSGVTTYTYDLLGRKTSIKDSLNRTTTFTFDLVGNSLTQTAPDSTVTTRTYDVMDRLASVTDPLNHTTTYAYNVPLRTTTVTDALNRVTTSTTDALDRKLTHQDPSGNITSNTYDAAGRLVSTTDALNHSTTYTYNSRGHLLSSTDPLGQVTLSEVDALGRPTATITPAPLSLRTESLYDAVGNLTSTKRPDGLFVTRLYDSMNRLLRVTEPQIPVPQVTEYTYHPTGIVHTLKDPKGQITTWTYDKLRRLTQKSYANGNTHNYTYNAAGELLTHTTPNGHIASHVYNLKGQLLTQTWNTTTPATSYTYYADGQTASITHGGNVIQYTYDAAHQLLTDTQFFAGLPALATTASHDLSGRRTDTTFSTSHTVKYAWTPRNQLASVELDGPPPFAYYTYDAAGRLTSLAHENDITESLSYDSNSRLLARTHSHNGSPITGHSYLLDNLGRRTAETFSDAITPARTYGYDPTSQVTSASYGGGQTDDYNYDAMGNRTNTTITGRTPTSGSPASAMYATNTVNQYVSVTGIAAPITHDANGNLTLQNQNTYTWDSHNRLLSLVPNSPAIGDKALHHSYDGLHRRVWSQVREWNGSSWINLDTTRFRYDACNVVEEYNIVANTQTLVRTRTWGSDLSGSLQGAGGVGGLLLTEEINGSNTTAYHHHYDGNGNVTEITTGLTAASAASYRYDAFGNTLVATGPYATTNKYRFSTKPLNSEVANAPLYYYGYRYYDPATGRWPSRDPIEEKGGLNLYGFISNNCINTFDILGLSCKQDCMDTFNRKLTSVTAMAVVMVIGCSAVPPPFSFICYSGVIVWEVAEIKQLEADLKACLEKCPCESQPPA